jgi:hypothetical protein
MTAVVSVKRCADEQHLEGLLLAYKKIRSEDDEIQLTPVFKFAGTVKYRCNAENFAKSKLCGIKVKF